MKKECKPFNDVERICIEHNCEHFICWEFWGDELHSCELVGQSNTIEAPVMCDNCIANKLLNDGNKPNH